MLPHLKLIHIEISALIGRLATALITNINQRLSIVSINHLRGLGRIDPYGLFWKGATDSLDEF